MLDAACFCVERFARNELKSLTSIYCYVTVYPLRTIAGMITVATLRVTLFVHGKHRDVI